MDGKLDFLHLSCVDGSLKGGGLLLVRGGLGRFSAHPADTLLPGLVAPFGLFGFHFLAGDAEPEHSLILFVEVDEDLVGANVLDSPAWYFDLLAVDFYPFFE